MNNLSTLTRADLQNAQKKEVGFSVCPAGKHVAKVQKFVEEDNYNLVNLLIDGKNYNFFYNYTLRNSDALDADVLNWIIGLSTIPVTDSTTLLQITNSAIGYSYEIETYTYTPTTGKNAGKQQHGIQFSVVPKLVTVDVESEELDVEDEELPY